MQTVRRVGAIASILLSTASLAACVQPIPAPPAASANDPVAVFAAFNAAFNAHDVDAALEFFAADAVVQLPNQPPPNLFKGKTEIRNFVESGVTQNAYVVTEDVQATGETVTGTARVETADLRPLGITLEGAVEVTVQQGKITAFSFVLSDETLAKLEAVANSPLQELVGAWSLEITAEKQNVTFPGLLTFTSDGIVLGDEPPGAFETTAHGNWVTTGPSTARFTFVALIGSAEGATKVSAKLKVVGALEYDAHSDSWNGPFKIWVNDVNGQELLADSGTFQGTRIAVETLD